MTGEDDAPDEEADTVPEDHDHSVLDPAVPALFLDENMSLREEILQRRKQTKKLTLKQQFGIHRFAGSDLPNTEIGEVLECR